ncbi:GNAT family N-acetyltransferase [Salininema proteolyticum]|uniref:GNAT family N-acetyltransferase n=1 Tax=Salininema proteolyticum TaxID=1607685 RepID=A0ABV8U2L2_9ACTN
MPRKCRNCVFWELSPLCAEAALEVGDPELEKEAWISQTLLEWGSCGRLAFHGRKPAGFVVYASPKFVPRAAEFPSGPVSADAALVTTVYVVPELVGKGVGRQLIQAAAADVRRKGIYAMEAFGDSRAEKDACMAPADFFRSVGFKTVAPDRNYPRLRMEMHGAITREAEAAADHDMQTEIDLLLLDSSSMALVKEGTGSPRQRGLQGF